MDTFSKAALSMIDSVSFLVASSRSALAKSGARAPTLQALARAPLERAPLRIVNGTAAGASFAAARARAGWTTGNVKEPAPSAPGCGGPALRPSRGWAGRELGALFYFATSFYY